MTPTEIKAAANAKIVLLDGVLSNHNPVSLALAADRVPDDQRAEALLSAADKALNQSGRVFNIRHMARVRELLARYVSA